MSDAANSSGGDELNPVGVLAAAIAVTTWGLSGVVAKDIDMGGLATGGYRFTIYGLVMGSFLWVRGTRIDLRIMRESMWGGIALGADVAFFFSAIKLTTVANATVIGALQPVVVSLVAARFFGERIHRRDMVLGGVAIVGVSLVVFGTGQEPPDIQRIHDRLCALDRRDQPSLGARFWSESGVAVARLLGWFAGARLWCGDSRTLVDELVDPTDSGIGSRPRPLRH